MRVDLACSRTPHFAEEMVWVLNSARWNISSAKTEGKFGSIIQGLKQGKRG